MAFIRKIKRGGRVYLARVENQRIGGKVIQKHIEYLGLDPDSSRTEFSVYPRDLTVDSVKVYGPVIVLESIARELGLFELFGEISAPVVVLAIAHCMDYKSVDSTANWYETTDLSTVTNFNITGKSLHNALERVSEMDFSIIEKSIFEKLTKFFGTDSSGVVYDGTNTHLAGSRSDLAKKGKDKEGVRGRNLIQIGLGATRSLGLPIFHQVHAGNIHDSKMFQEAIFRFKDLNVESGIAVFDRGITSKSCISRIHRMGWKSLAGIPMHRGIKNSIANLDFDQAPTFRNLVVQGDTKFQVYSIPYDMGEVNGRLIILLNYLKKQKLRMDRMAQIDRARTESLERDSYLPDDLIGYFTKDGKINHHAIKRSENYDALSFIFTDSKLPKNDVVRHYFAKDLIERCFRLTKGSANLHPINLSVDSKIKSHVKICYISLALLTTIRLRLEKASIFKEPREVLRSLETIFKVYMTAQKKKEKNKSNSEKDKYSFYKVNTVSKLQETYIKIIAPQIRL